MPDLLLPDTSCLIFLGKLGQLDTLTRLYGKVKVTTEVAEEHILDIPSWIDVVEVTEKRHQQLLEQSVDRGEASIIALAMELEDCIVSIDDLRARKIARSLGLRLTGTLGILYKAKTEGLIPSMRQAIDQLKSVDFRISASIEQELLKLSAEV